MPADSPGLPSTSRVVLRLHWPAPVRFVAIIVPLVLIAAYVKLTYVPAVASAEARRPIAHLQEVRSVSLDGRALPLARLRDVIQTRPGEPLDLSRLDLDRKAMLRALASLGYLGARVEPASVTYDATGAAYVSFEIDQGPVFHVRRVTTRGAGNAIITLAAGDTALPSRFEAARAALADALTHYTRHAAPASVELSVHTDPAAAAVDIDLTVAK